MIIEATKMVQKNYEQFILKYSSETKKHLFESHQIDDENDWTSKKEPLKFHKPRK